MPKKKKKGYFGDMQDTALGIAGVGLVSGVAGGVASQAGAPAGYTQGLSTMAGFVPVGVTAIAGRSTLKQVQKLKKYKKKKKSYY